MNVNYLRSIGIVVIRVAAALLAMTHLLGYAWFSSPSRGFFWNLFAFAPFLGLMLGALLPDKTLRFASVRVLLGAILAASIARYAMALWRDIGSGGELAVAMHIAVLLVLSLLCVRLGSNASRAPAPS